MYGRGQNKPKNVKKNREMEESKQTVTCAICMEYYKDARQLACSHSFCLACLVSFQSDKLGNSPCPTCRKTCVPPLSQLHSLPSNTFANNLAELISAEESPSPHTNSGDSRDGGATAAGSSAGDAEMFVGQIIEEPRRPQRTKFKPWQAGLVIAACAVGCGVSGFAAAATISGLAYCGSKIKDKVDKRAKEAYHCCGCGDRVYDTQRYRCGMCRDDVTICPKCFRNRSLVRQHNPNHIFLVLPSKPKRFLPSMPLLKPSAKELADSFVYGNTGVAHGKAYVHTPERLIKLNGIQCRTCLMQPILGTRYKCGYCRDFDLCSSCYDEREHDPDHVFLALAQYCEVNVIKEPLLRAQFY